MFNQIRDIDNSKTIVTYLIMLCAIGVTSGTLLFPNLENVYGVFDNDMSTLQWFTLPLTHGFDTLSGLIHLGVNLVFFGMIGNFMEKILGSFNFLIICIAGFIWIGILGNLLEFRDQGLHAITWIFAPLVLFTLSEGRRIKTRTMYEEHYKLLRTLVALMLTIIPITGIFLQFFVTPEISVTQAIYQGMSVYVSSLVLGFALVPANRKLIKENLKYFNRKKRLKTDPNVQAAKFGALVIPLFLIVVFILGN